MAITITQDNQAPGKGGTRPVFAQGSSVLKVITGQIDFDDSYPSGGEDISAIFDEFKNMAGTSGAKLLGILVEDPTDSAGTGKSCVVDYTNKKLKLYTNASPPVEVNDASDQSGAADLRFIAFGTL